MTELQLIQKEKILEQKRKEYEFMRWRIAQKANKQAPQAPASPD